MSKEITSYTYITEPKEIILAFDDESTETFTAADAARYLALTSRPADLVAIGWQKEEAV
jgi:hypothetical protein